jgi:hypothetical protein
MQTFYVTFGLKYRDVRHPKFPAAHPDGWVEIIAEGEPQAWEAAERVFGTVAPGVVEIAFLYREDRWDPSFYPDGCIAVIERGGVKITYASEVPE